MNQKWGDSLWVSALLVVSQKWIPFRDHSPVPSVPCHFSVFPRESDLDLVSAYSGLWGGLGLSLRGCQGDGFPQTGQPQEGFLFFWAGSTALLGTQDAGAGEVSFSWDASLLREQETRPHQSDEHECRNVPPMVHPIPSSRIFSAEITHTHTHMF